jgi:hypothetical protein
MTKVIVAKGCREIDSPTTGTRYYAQGGARGYQGGGLFDMSPADARLAVRMGGALASLNGPAARAEGFTCPACGFGSFFRVCGRCGSECERP